MASHRIHLLAFALILASVRPAGAQTVGADSSAAAAPVPPPSTGTAPPRVGGYLQVREIAQARAGLTTVLNRARASLDGALPAKFSYRLLLEFQASAGRNAQATVSLREATAKWTSAPFAATAGEMKTPFSREYLIPVPALELADLATVIDSMAPKYDIGVMAEYAIGAVATVAAGVFNGEGANATVNRDSTVMLVGRVTGRPIPQLALGASFARDDSDSVRWGVDASAQQSGAVIRAEYVMRHRKGRARDRDDSGWYVLESFRVTPRIQLLGRQENFQRPSYGVARRLRSYTWGANVDLAPNRVRLLLEFVRRLAGSGLLRSDGAIVQLQVQF